MIYVVDRAVGLTARAALDKGSKEERKRKRSESAPRRSEPLSCCRAVSLKRSLQPRSKQKMVMKLTLKKASERWIATKTMRLGGRSPPKKLHKYLNLCIYAT